jgi:hypothetical protein
MLFEGRKLSSGCNRPIDFSASIFGSTNCIRIGRDKVDMQHAGKNGVHVRGRQVVWMSLCAGYQRALS